MEKFLAIGIVVVLIIVFFITYVLNKKTPKPKGCESLEINDENCGACNNTACELKSKIDLKKIEEELKEEK